MKFIFSNLNLYTVSVVFDQIYAICGSEWITRLIFEINLTSVLVPKTTNWSKNLEFLANLLSRVWKFVGSKATIEKIINQKRNYPCLTSNIAPYIIKNEFKISQKGEG